MPFWIAAAALTIAVAGLLLLALRRGGPAAATGDLDLYRDQLAEVERDLARGTVAAEEAERLRTEISRRILEADRAQAGRRAPGSAPRTALAAAGLAILAASLGAFWLYARLGTPGYPDQPLAARLAFAEDLRAARPGQAELEARAMPWVPDEMPEAGYGELLDKLRAAVADRPFDLEGQELLARNEAALGNFAAAARAQAQVVRLKEPRARAADFAAQADLMILAAGGGVSPEAEQVLMQALQRDPREPLALFYTGLLLDQTGRPDLAFRLWRDLLEDSAPQSPWVPTLRAQLPRLAWLAGVDYQLPPEGAPGPTGDDIAAAADMSAEDRELMVRGMVDRLSDRLSREGGTAADWARLVSALGVLGEHERAGAIWTEAQTVFAGRPAELATVREAALRAGIGR